MRFCIHRGAREIGGTCVEVESGTARLLLDLGLPLSSAPGELGDLSHVEGLENGDHPRPLGVVVSHAHLDHYGLVPHLPAHFPFYMGEACARILEAAAFFSPAGAVLRPTRFLRHRQPLQIGPFVVTPYLVDHSAYDSYAIEVEADGHALFYSGDLRAHGRKPGTFGELLADPPRDVDVLLLEGTRITSSRTELRPRTSEHDLELALVERFAPTKGLTVVLAAAQNIDRLVTAYRAARRSGRTLVIDLYAASLVEAIDRPTIPKPGTHDVRVYIPNRQRMLVKEAGEFARTRAVSQYRVFRDELAAQPTMFTLLAQPSTLSELARGGCLQDAHAVWSMWAGYLNTESGRRARAILDGESVPLEFLHSSGHAEPSDLRALAAAINARRTIPIHTAAPERAARLFDATAPARNGEWISCRA